jgi:hypothetical protein
MKVQRRVNHENVERLERKEGVTRVELQPVGAIQV